MAIAIKTKDECKRVCVYEIKSRKWYVWNRDLCNSSNSGIDVNYRKKDVGNSNESVENVFLEEAAESKIKMYLLTVSTTTHNVNL